MRLLWVVIPFAVVVVALIVLRILTKKRVFGTLLALVIVAGVGFTAYSLWVNRPQPDPLLEGNVVKATRGSITEVVEATGNLAPAAQLNLGFSTGGKLAQILVATGDRVDLGQPLAVLDQTDLQLNLAQSEAALKVSEANLDKLLAGSRSEDVTVARQNLYQAQVALEQQRATLAAATEQARLSWVESANALRDAQANYENIYWENRKLEDRIGKENMPDANIDNEAKAKRAVENAEAAMEAARLSYEQAKEREDSSVRTAQSQVTTAQTNLDRLLAGATQTDVAAAQASVDQTRASVNIYQTQLDKATLRAPFPGVVATILATVNTQVSIGTPILVLFDPSSYLIDVEVDEVDISRVQIGQPVSITLDALPDVQLSARVEEMALTPSAGQGVVTYRVRVRIAGQLDATVRPGMSANARIITREATGVLIVPRRAVRANEDGNTYVERVLPNDQLEVVTVTLGLEDPNYVEILSGLQEGDPVFVRGVVEKNPLQQFMNSSGGSSSGGMFQP